MISIHLDLPGLAMEWYLKFVHTIAKEKSFFGSLLKCIDCNQSKDVVDSGVLRENMMIT